MKPPLFSCLTSRVANNGSLYGRFLFGPLPIDISLTVATVLRRSLLHSQATFTIVSAEIEGATHEYASLPGIQESVLEILLNLGEIVLTSTQRNLINPNFRTYIGTNPFFFANIRVSGPGIVTAKDINWPKGIFCVKPNSVICTLSSNETLTMRLKIACSLNKNISSFQQATSKDLEANSILDMPIAAGTALPERSIQSQKNLSRKLTSEENKEGLFTSTPNQFEFFKSQENLSTITSVNSLERKIKIDTTKASLLESHFIRIQNKNLFSSKTKEKETNKGNTTQLYQQTIEATQRLLTKHTGSLDSYSIRKKKVKLAPEKHRYFYPITNKDTIFHDNKSQSKINGIKSQNQATVMTLPGLTDPGASNGTPESQSIKKPVQNQGPRFSIGNPEDMQNGQLAQTTQKNQNRSQDLDKNVTFQIFPGLFNDFKQSSKADPFFLKKENEHNVKENKQEAETQELDISNKIQGIKQQNLFSNPEINNQKKAQPNSYNKQTLSSNKVKQKSTPKTFKHELLVSSSSYPVEKVNFLIERDDELAGYRHRIILEVWTNGSISPRQAIFESIGSIIKLIYNFREPLRNSFS